MLFNKRIHAELGLDCPYQLVHEGRWTLDRFEEMARAAVSSVDGFSLIGAPSGVAVPSTVRFGYKGQAHVFTPAFMIGSGLRYVNKDNDDMPYLALNRERNRAIVSTIEANLGRFEAAIERTILAFTLG